MRVFPLAALSVMVLVIGCASPQRGPAPVMSSDSRAVVAAESAPKPELLDWSRLEAAVVESAKDQGARLPADRLRSAAKAYALEVNRVEEAALRQFHIDRAAVVLERQVFTGVTLAEGAALRAIVRGGSGGGPSGARGIGRSQRDTGRTSGISGTTTSGFRDNSTR